MKIQLGCVRIIRGLGTIVVQFAISADRISGLKEIILRKDYTYSCQSHN